MLKRNLSAGIVCVFMLATMGNSNPASAAIWGPPGKALAIEGGFISIQIETSKNVFELFECNASLAATTIGASATKIKFRPAYKECNRPIEVPKGIQWNAVAVSATQANLELPSKAAILTVRKGCEIIVEANTMGSTKDFSAGISAKWAPFGTFTPHFREVPSKCFNGSKTQAGELFFGTYELTAEGAEEEVTV